jgi:hypothetical protein
MLYVIAVDD